MNEALLSPAASPAELVAAQRAAEALVAGLATLARRWSQLDLKGSAPETDVLPFATLAQGSIQKLWIALRADAWGATGFLAFDHAASDAFVHAFLGGGAMESPQSSAEAPTGHVASNLLKRVALAAIDAYGTGFPAVAAPRARLVGFGPRPEALIPDAEPMLVQRLPFTIGAGQGIVTLAWPLAAVRIAARRRSAETPAPVSTAVASRLASTEVEVAVVAGEAALTVRELLSLAAGDILALGLDADEPWTLTVEGQPQAHGVPGVRRGHRVLKIV